MLTLTHNAVSAIRGLTIASEISDTAGLRITSTSESGMPELVVSIAASPEPLDETVETEGARVYVDPSTAPMLEDHMLDAEAEDHGQIRFELKPQMPMNGNSPTTA